MTKTKKQLIIDNKELISRIVEFSDTLSAIRSGEVDAIVVSGTKGEQVYSINSAETPYRSFVEEMNEGAVTLSREGLILYCNRRFAELVNQPVEFVIGSYFNHFIAPYDKSNFDNLFAQLTHNDNEFLTVSLINSLYLKLSIHLLPPYLQEDNCVLIATDITELKNKENELLELHHLLKQHLDHMKGLRIDLINAKIEANTENNKLKNTNKKLAKEITRHKFVNEELEQKVLFLTKK